jgi:hypothetical protein
MTAIVIKPLKNGTKKIYGEVMRRGFGRISLWVYDRNGHGSLKSFQEDKYTVIVNQ